MNLILLKKNLIKNINMKTALLFSGQLRGFKHTFENIKKNLINNFGECDMFFYLGEDEKTFIYDYTDKNNVIFYKDTHHENTNNTLDNPSQHVWQTFLSQWYSVMKCKDLMLSQNKKYDYVIRIRPDIIFNGEITPSMIDIDKINSSSVGTYSHLERPGINDKISIGSFENMNIYCNFFMSDSIKNFYGNSEQKLFNYLTENKLDVNTFDVTLYKINENGQNRGF